MLDVKAGSTNALDVGIRYLLRPDMQDVLAIERRAHPREFRWSKADFLHYLRERNVMGLVAEHFDYGIVGHVVYELRPGFLIAHNLTVDPEHRRRRVGAQMMARLIDKLSAQKRHRIEIRVSEANLPMHLFLQACHFVAVEVERDAYEEYDMDGYWFAYNLPGSEYEFSYDMEVE